MLDISQPGPHWLLVTPGHAQALSPPHPHKGRLFYPKLHPTSPSLLPTPAHPSYPGRTPLRSAPPGPVLPPPPVPAGPPMPLTQPHQQVGTAASRAHSTQARSSACCGPSLGGGGLVLRGRVQWQVGSCHPHPPCSAPPPPLPSPPRPTPASAPSTPQRHSLPFLQPDGP